LVRTPSSNRNLMQVKGLSPQCAVKAFGRYIICLLARTNSAYQKTVFKKVSQ
jgi:hypothetical protein